MKAIRSDVLIDARLEAYRRGGISRYIQALCHWLPRVAPDLSVEVVTNRPGNDLPLRPSRVITPAHFRFERLTFGAEATLRRPRIVHSPDFIAPRGIGMRRVVTIHDLNFLNHPEHVDPASLRYYEQVRQSARVADRIIVVSAFTGQQVVNQLSVDPDKLEVIRNGVDDGNQAMSIEQARSIVRSTADESAAKLISSGRPIILSVGTIEPRKRHQLLIGALELPTGGTRGLEPVLLIVGQRGWQCDEIVDEIRDAARSQNVLWLDSADDELLNALYSLATVLVVPSVEEGFGLPMLEAMTRGLPVIASRSGAIPEIAGDAALLVDDDRPETWRRAFDDLIADPDRRCQMIVRGRERATEFSWEETVRRTAGVYREVLNR